jgi:tyrosine-protein kinase Etk/Wzc
MSWHEMMNIVVINIKNILKITTYSTIFIFIVLLFIYPHTYESTVSILPPEKNTGYSGLGSLLGQDDISGLLTSKMSSGSSQLFVEILKSRTAATFVVKKLNLKRFYNSDDNIEASEKLQKNLNIDLSKEGIIKLYVDLKSNFVPLLFSNSDSLKILSSKISNAYVEALDKINREKSSSKAKSARLYIEDQLKVTRTMLDSAEFALLNFQKKNKAIAIPEQIKEALAASAKIKSEIIQTELQLNFIKGDVDSNNKIYIALSKKLDELKYQYSKFENTGGDYSLAFKDLPDLGKELAGLVRDIKIQNDVYILLEQQYYKEKIQENKDIPTVDILDEAIPPKKVSSPRLIYSTCVGSLFTFLFSSIVFLFMKKNKK